MKQYTIEPKICKATKAIECNEPLVELSRRSKLIIIDIEETSRKAQRLKPGKCFVRKSVAEKLINIQSRLPQKLRLKVFDSYRPLSAQRRIWKQVFTEIKKKNPQMLNKKVELETDKWVANPGKIVPLHSTGGTLDLTLCKANGTELNMGSSTNSIGIKSVTNATIPQKYRVNRNILIKVMSDESFANYQREWWHWSYGDWGWAAANKTTAIYKALENKKFNKSSSK